MYTVTFTAEKELPHPHPSMRTFKSSHWDVPVHIPVGNIVSVVPSLPTIPGTAIWANLKDDPQANLEAFFLNSNGFWMDKRCRNYRPEQIHTWKPYSEHTPQPYD